MEYSTRPTFLRAYIPGDVLTLQLYEFHVDLTGIPPVTREICAMNRRWSQLRKQFNLYERMGAVPRSSKMTRFMKEFGIYTSLFGFTEHT